ncbi:MAG: hypothetical protein WC429_22250, partial [Verrucomicrobiia bacterium]
SGRHEQQIARSKPMNDFADLVVGLAADYIDELMLVNEIWIAPEARWELKLAAQAHKGRKLMK